jgi:hypothetical protein
LELNVAAVADHHQADAGEDLHQPVGLPDPSGSAQLPMIGRLSEGQRMTDDERFKRWGEQILKIHEEMMYALVSRRIHNEVGAILRANPRLWHENNSFYMWMAEIYEDSGVLCPMPQKGIFQKIGGWNSRRNDPGWQSENDGIPPIISICYSIMAPIIRATMTRLKRRTF